MEFLKQITIHFMHTPFLINISMIANVNDNKTVAKIQDGVQYKEIDICD